MIGGRQKSRRDENVQARPDRQPRRDRHSHRPGGRVARRRLGRRLHAGRFAVAPHQARGQGAARSAVGADPVRGYLDIDAIIAAAKESGSDCVHPGYGFLSENANFARTLPGRGPRASSAPRPRRWRCSATRSRRAPSPRRRAFPSSPARRRRWRPAPRPRRWRKSIGYPVMLKASAGGGGRGMRAVTRPEEMDEAFARCQSEAEAAFGDRRGLPREDRAAAAPHRGAGAGRRPGQCRASLRARLLGAAAPPEGRRDRPRARTSTTALRQRILADAVTLARAARYENAGTVEFLVEPRDRRALLHRVQSAHPGRAHGHRAGDGLRPRRGAVPHRRRRLAGGAGPCRPEVGRHAARLCRAGARRRPGHRHAQRLPRAVRAGRAGRCLRLPRAGAAAAVRSPARQADLPVGLLGHLRLGGRSPGPRARRVPHRRRADQRRAAARHPGASRVQGAAMRAPPCCPRPWRRRKAKSGALQFLDQQAAALGRGRGAASAPPGRPLPVPPGHEAIESPHAGSVVEVKAREGDPVKAGDLLFVVSAMKMETSVQAPCAGVVDRAAPRWPWATPSTAGRSWPSSSPPPARPRPRRRLPADESWTPMLDKVSALRGDRPQAPGARLERPGRGPPAQSPQAHLPRAHRRPARSRQLPRDRQPGGLRHLRRGGRRRSNSRRPATSAARAASRAAPASSAPTTSPRAAAMPTARSARSRAISTGCRSSCARPRSACSTARRAAAASPPWCPSRTARRHRPRKAPAPSRPAGRAWSAAAARSCPAISAAPTTPSSSPRCRWSTCCWAAWSASAPPRRCSGTSPSWCATSRSSSSPVRRSSATPWATRSPRRISAAGTSTAATARSTTWPSPKRKPWR